MVSASESLCLALYGYIFKNYILNSHINHLFQQEVLSGIRRLHPTKKEMVSKIQISSANI